MSNGDRTTIRADSAVWAEFEVRVDLMERADVGGHDDAAVVEVLPQFRSHVLSSRCSTGGPCRW
jgi:hypothetical protein